VTLPEVVLALMWIGVTLYAVFAGADFGAGIWDLLAGGARAGRSDRRLVEERIGPVWEANHVWLIFVLVVLWTGFPTAFAAIMSTLYVPLTAAAIGIILRGAGFAFRKSVDRPRLEQAFGIAFAASSLITPFFLGAVAGAVASGRVEVDPRTIDPFSPWMHPTSLLGGALAVVSCAYLAATFLAADATRRAEPDLAERHRTQGIATAVVTGAIALGGIAVLHADAPDLFHNLTHRGLPLVIVAGVAGATSVVLLVRRAYRSARVAVVVAVTSVIWGWAAGQYPDLLVDRLTIADAAGSRATLTAMLVSLAVGSVLFVPPLVALLVLHARGELDHPPDA
jgi:cytochrome d ubiquinol oxidase subunit II